MNGKTIGIAVAAVLVAFAAAFGIGKATAGEDTTKPAPSPVKAFKPDQAQTQLASFEPSGSLPAPRKEKKKKAARKKASGGGGGSAPAPSKPSAPSTPAPSRPSAPAPSRPSAPAPSAPSGGGGGG